MDTLLAALARDVERPHAKGAHVVDGHHHRTGVRRGHGRSIARPANSRDWKGERTDLGPQADVRLVRDGPYRLGTAMGAE